MKYTDYGVEWDDGIERCSDSDDERADVEETEMTQDHIFMVTDCNHPGVVFCSKDKTRLQRFSQLLSEEGSCMTKIVNAYCTAETVCDIDTYWSGRTDINPFYYWYFENT